MLAEWILDTVHHEEKELVMKYRHLILVIIIYDICIIWAYGCLYDTPIYEYKVHECESKPKLIQYDDIMLDIPKIERIVTEPAVTVKPTIKPTKCPYDKEELRLLAHLINAEAGSDWCSDDMQYYVGSVVLNRMASDRYPDTMYGVIYQKGQYACVDNGHINREPCNRAWRIAKDLLINGSVLPAKVIYQAEFRQGNGTYCIEQNMYFCYD